MSRCGLCKHEVCYGRNSCIMNNCPVYSGDAGNYNCGCCEYDFDKNEDCPYFVDRRNNVCIQMVRQNHF